MHRICALRALIFVGNTLLLHAQQTVKIEGIDISGIWKEQGPGAPGAKNLPAPFRSGDAEARSFKVDGQFPPLLPEPARLYRERVAQAQAGKPYRNTVSKCLPPGIPTASIFSFYPVQILQTPGQITMLYEEENHFRIIRLNAQHPKELEETFFGDSIGKWEGDTLTVDSVGFRDDTTIDWLGLPHSTDMHVIERIRKIAPDTLQFRITIDDPKTFTRSWEAISIWKRVPPDVRITENICENTRFFE